MYCFDTDALSALLKRQPSLSLIRRLAQIPPEQQFTTAITVGELLYGASRREGSPQLVNRVRNLLESLIWILPFDEQAAEIYGRLRSELERKGQRLDEPDLRIASIAISRQLVLVTGNIRHFARIPELQVENWLKA